MSVDQSPPAAPTPLIRRFVRYGAGFGVGVAVGFGPFLGTVGVPGFKALLELFPEIPPLRNTLIPLSAFLMGLVAVTVQFFSGENPARRKLRRGFVGGLAAVLAGFLALVVVSGLFVQDLAVEGAQRTVRVMISWHLDPACRPQDGGPAGVQDQIAGITLDPALLQACYGSGRLKAVQLALTLSYLVVTSGFGVLIGLLLLQEEARRRSRRRRSR